MSLSSSAITGIMLPPSAGFGFAPCLRRVSKISGAEACKATLNADARPHDSIGTSINLKIDWSTTFEQEMNILCVAFGFYLRNFETINFEFQALLACMMQEINYSTTVFSLKMKTIIIRSYKKIFCQ